MDIMNIEIPCAIGDSVWYLSKTYSKCTACDQTDYSSKAEYTIKSSEITEITFDDLSLQLDEHGVLLYNGYLDIKRIIEIHVADNKQLNLAHLRNYPEYYAFESLEAITNWLKENGHG